MKAGNVLLTILLLSIIPVSASAVPPDQTGQGTQIVTQEIMKRWLLSCDGEYEDVAIRFTIGSGGMLKGEPEWVQPRDGKVWQSASEHAIAAIKRAQPYGNLPDEFYNHPLTIFFDARKACQGR